MVQMARNLTDAEEPFLRHTRFLIMDRDTKYSASFRTALIRERVEPIRLPPRSPNLNAFAERFVRSIKSECLNGPLLSRQPSQPVHRRQRLGGMLNYYHRAAT